MYVGIILGSDKTTVSVTTGNVEYYPLYISIGNIHNSARWGYRNAVVPIGFLAIPKCTCLILLMTSLVWLAFYSRSQARWWPCVPNLQEAALPSLHCSNPTISEACYDQTSGSTLSRWTFPTGDLRFGILYCRLSRTSSPCGSCIRMVRKVSHYCFSILA